LCASCIAGQAAWVGARYAVEGRGVRQHKLINIGLYGAATAKRQSTYRSVS
jgi:hypothetical protein